MPSRFLSPLASAFDQAQRFRTGAAADLTKPFETGESVILQSRFGKIPKGLSVKACGQ